MDEWKEYKIKDVTSILGDGIHGTPKYDENGSVFFINGNNLENGKIVIRENTKRVSPEEAAKHQKPLNDRTIFVSINGTLGNVARYNGEPCILGKSACYFNVKEEFDIDFIYYVVSNNEFRKEIERLATGTTIKNVSLETMRNYTFSVPSRFEQKKVASILKSLDDKIEVNRKINENLEQQAQALFKSWFVDFEPFKNGEFVESELGMIPKGWRVGRYDDIIESTISGDWGKEKPEGNYTHKVACIRGCDFQDIKNGLRGKTPERFILEKNFQTKHFKDKDVLVEISGGTATVSTGRVCPVSQLLIDKFNDDIVCTNFCRLVRPRNNYGAYLYYSWLYKYNNKVMFGYENGTSGIKNFRIKDFISLEPVVIPSEEALLAFQSMIDKLQMKLQMNGSESQKLATLRDTLLPKLMSGELNVFDKPNDQS